MAFSTQRAVSDGSMTYLDISIKYQKRADIQVFYNNLPADPATWSWVGTTDKRIQFTNPVPAGTEVLLKRTTRIDSIINVFALGAKFTNASMDTNFEQLMYLNQEAVEGAALTDIFNDVDFHGYRIRNLGAAENDNEAITLGQAKAQGNNAWDAANAAIAARDLAQKWASQTPSSVDGTNYSAKQYALNAAGSASAAWTSADNANNSAISAAGSATAAAGSANAAANSASASSTSAGQSAASATNSANSATASANSATASGDSAAAAAASADLAASNAAAAGGFRFSGRQVINGNTTATSAFTGSTVIGNSATGATLTIPPAVFANNGAMMICNWAAGPLTVAMGSGGAVFNPLGASSFILSTNKWAIISSNGGTTIDIVAGSPLDAISSSLKDGIYSSFQGGNYGGLGMFRGTVNGGPGTLKWLLRDDPGTNENLYLSHYAAAGGAPDWTPFTFDKATNTLNYSGTLKLTDNPMDFNGYRAKNLGSPVALTDGATLGTVSTFNSGVELILNGTGSIRQEFTTSPVNTASNIAFADLWYSTGSGSGFTFNADVGGALGVSATSDDYALSLTTNSAKATLAASDAAAMVQPVEGTFMKRLRYGTAAARSSWVRFRAKATVNCTASLYIRNRSGSRAYCVPFNVTTSVGDYAFLIPGDTDTTFGNWGTGAQMEAQFGFCFAAGSSFTAPSASTWVSGAYIAAPGQTNLLSASTQRLMIADVSWRDSDQLLPFVLPRRDEEIRRCQRYYAHTYDEGITRGTTTLAGMVGMVNTGASAGQLDITWKLPVNMVKAPTCTAMNGSTGGSGTWQNGSGTNQAVSFSYTGTTNVTAVITSVPAGNVIAGHIVADARMI